MYIIIDLLLQHIIACVYKKHYVISHGVNQKMYFFIKQLRT